MKIKCDTCGSNEFKKGENDFLCVNCGLIYSKEQIVTMIEKANEEEKKQRRKEIIAYFKNKKIISKLSICLLMIIITITITITLINYSKRAPISFLRLGRKISTETIVIDARSDYRNPQLLARFLPDFKLADCYEYYYNTTREYEKEIDKVTASGLMAPMQSYVEYDEIKNDHVFINTPYILIVNIKNHFFPKKYYYYSIYQNNERTFEAESILGYMYRGYEIIEDPSNKDSAYGRDYHYYSSFIFDNEVMTKILGLKDIRVRTLNPTSISWLESIGVLVERCVWDGITLTSKIEKYEKYTRVKLNLVYEEITIYINNETNELEYEETKNYRYRVVYKKSNKYEYLLKENERLLKKYKKQVEIYNYRSE